MSVTAADREYGPPQFISVQYPLPAAVAYDPPRDRLFVLTFGSPKVHYISYISSRGAIWDDTSDMDISDAWIPFEGPADPTDTAALAQPQGISVDLAGNVYVADTFHNQARLYRRNPETNRYTLDADFTSDTRTLVDGVAIDRPRDIAVAADGTIYLLDSGNRRILRANGPNARRWTVHHQGRDWSEARGLAVASSGEIYVADTNNHRIIRIHADGSEDSFGRFGRDPASFRYPNDVAVGEDGRIYIADTHNHRISIFDAAHRYYRLLGQAPLLRNPEKLALGPDHKLFIADSERADILGYLGDAGQRPDGYVRDFDRDEGLEPSTAADVLRSPDIIVRLHPDLDVERATRDGLDAFGSEAVVPGREYFLYFAVNNGRRRPLPPGALRVYTSQPSSTESLYRFPEEWLTHETFPLLHGVAATESESLLRLPEIGPRGWGLISRTVVGPLSWRPRSTTDSCDTHLFVMARHLNVHDPIDVVTNDGLEQAWASNDVAVRRIPFVAPHCIPRGDRYESNDEAGTAARILEPWQHLHARCPRTIARAMLEPYPDALCEGIFEDGLAPRFAEEIWTRDISNLSLHGNSDADFFRIDLPELEDPIYGVNDINPAHIREFMGDRPGYVPVVMPECGIVHREDIDLAGLDDRISIMVNTELVLEVTPEGPPESEVAPRPIQTADEQLYVYVDNEGSLSRDTELFTGTPLRKRVTCPRTEHSLEDILLSFGERESREGGPSPRDLLMTGGYKLSVRYISSIRRGVPEWVGDPGITGEINHLDCYGRGTFSGSGGQFPLCGNSGFDRIGLIENHRGVTTECIADGPGCFSTYLFHWPADRARFDMAFAARRGLRISLIDDLGNTIATTQLSPNSPPAFMSEFKGVDLSSLQPKDGDESPLLGGTIELGQLSSGYYGLKIEGAPTDFAISFKPVLEEEISVSEDEIFDDIFF